MPDVSAPCSGRGRCWRSTTTCPAGSAQLRRGDASGTLLATARTWTSSATSPPLVWSHSSASMDVIADNIANANTPGYKAERVQFSDWLSRQRGTDAPQGDAAIAYTQDRATWRELRAGTLTHTGNPFDLGDHRRRILHGQNTARAAPDARRPVRSDARRHDGRRRRQRGAGQQRAADQLSPTDTQITIAGDGTVSSENGQLGQSRRGAADRSDAARGGGRHAVQLLVADSAGGLARIWCRARSRTPTFSRCWR